MRHGIPTTAEPTDPKSLYMRNMYHEFFWGPFKNEGDLIKAVKHLDEVDPYWDYDPFCIIYGANPLPADFVSGFKSIDEETADRIKSRGKR